MLRTRPTVLVVLLALLVVAAAPALAPADDEAPAVKKHEPPAAKKHEAKQPDVFEPRLDLMIWSIIVFAALLWVLKKFAWGPMLEGLQGREARIRGELEEAQSARAEAQKLREQLQAEMNQAQQKVRDLLDEGRRDAERATQEMIGKARTEIQTERDRLRREIGAARDQALQELWTQTAQLATLISAKAIGRQLSIDDHRRLVDEALGDLRKAGTQWQGQGAGGHA